MDIRLAARQPDHLAVFFGLREHQLEVFHYGKYE
jgi:hypothetical protein